MKLRVLSIAFLLGSLSTGATWLLLQPALFRLANAVGRAVPPGNPGRAALARLWRVLPLYLAFALVVVTLVSYVVLHLTVERPLRQTEQTINQLERLELEQPFGPSGGPLLSRLTQSLKKMADALLREQEVTKRQLADLRRAQTELVASERLATVGRLAAGVAHEVGNPLSGILGYLSIARDRARSNPELLDFLNRIDQEISRIDRIVRGLLELGRPVHLELRPVEVGALVETCANLVARGPDFDGVRLDFAVEPSARVNADSGALSQVLINLLLNAAQAMSGGGLIRVRGAKEGDRFVLSVTDSGPGISAEVVAHLFEPFFTTKTAGKGTGLGLAVSMHLVTAMRGHLSAANAEGGGARFALSLETA